MKAYAFHQAPGFDPRFPCYPVGLDGPLAQLVEHLPFKQGVAGSSPARLMGVSVFDTEPFHTMFHMDGAVVLNI